MMISRYCWVALVLWCCVVQLPDLLSASDVKHGQRCSLRKEPVCLVEAGITFQNLCLASQQLSSAQVASLKAGPCDSDVSAVAAFGGASQAVEGAETEEGHVDEAEVKKHAGAGYALVRKISLDKSSIHALDYKTIVEDVPSVHRGRRASMPGGTGPDLRSVLVERAEDGGSASVYVQVEQPVLVPQPHNQGHMPTQEESEALGSSEKHPEDAGGDTGRKMLNRNIINGESRTELKSFTYPYTAIGSLFVLFPGAVGWQRCTATAYDGNSVITAAHCLHAGGSGDYPLAIKFYPNEGRDSSQSCVMPAVHENYKNFQLYWSQWVTNGNWEYDYAVINFWTNVAPNYMPSGYTCNAWYSSVAVTNVGYPEEKPYCSRFIQTEYTSHDPCSWFPSNLIQTNLDITSGMSGGPVFETSTNKVIGVVSHIDCSGYWGCVNRFASFNSNTYPVIQQWAAM